MNTRGHKKTLVASHPGNRNAVKAGVFSPPTLAPRINDLEIQLAERREEDVAVEFLRHELAALAVLGQAMDQSLADAGLLGRGGQPKRLIDLRLRLNDKARKTLAQYEDAVARARIDSAPRPEEDEAELAPPPTDAVAEAISTSHGQPRGERVRPVDFDPEVFLRAIIITNDRHTRPQDVVRARRLLTRRRKERRPTCACFSTLRARNEVEFRTWVANLSGDGVAPSAGDDALAALVRVLARGEPPEHRNPREYRRLSSALEDVVRDAVLRAQGTDGESGDADQTQSEDPAAARFWDTMLSLDPQVATKTRLDAFVVLDEMEALPRCTCKPPKDLHLVEDRIDETRAFVVRMVARRHYRAALISAQFPSTYTAVQDVIATAIAAADAIDSESETRPDAA